MRFRSRRRARFLPTAAITLACLFGGTTPVAAADWQSSPSADVIASIVDLTVVRPLATMKVVVGALMFVPAAVFASPSGMEGIEGAYETLIEVPAEYAFERDIGEL